MEQTLAMLRQLPSNSVIGIGNFDGVHKGHQSILQGGKAESLKRHCAFAIITFTPHPRIYLQNKKDFLITPHHLKEYFLKRYGVDYVANIPFDAMAMVSADAFIQHIIVEALKPQLVITGENFSFGQGATGNKMLLEKRLKEAGIDFKAYGLYQHHGETVSSSIIRQHISQGAMEQATDLLGHPFIIEGTVIEGARLGRTIGFPTANIALVETIIPKLGVYAVTITIDGVAHRGVANIGNRPTVDGHYIRLEVYIFDFNADIYHKTASVALHHFIRPEQKFNGIDALKQQIQQDCLDATAWLNAHPTIESIVK